MSYVSLRPRWQSPVDNTDEDWERLEAACRLLGHLAPVEAVAVLKTHKRFQGE